MSRYSCFLNRRRFRCLLVALALTSGCCASALAGTKETEAFFRDISWQAALDGVGISPGLIDGAIGPKTRLATREFQRVRGLPQTGELDTETAAALKVDPDAAVGRYKIEQADLDEIGPVPTSWKAKSKLKRLGHESLETVLGEWFHCTVKLLRRLNPGVDINRLKPGDEVVVPIVREPEVIPQAEHVEINLNDKLIRVIDKDKRLVAMFHCSVAAKESKMLKGEAKVAVIKPDPEYRFDPEKWPEVKEKVDHALIIPPGPRNPVGRCWIGLNRSSVGMHGTPKPELIGKTGSHGCFRMANWDAIRLSKMVKVGTPVKFVDHPDDVKNRQRVARR